MIYLFKQGDYGSGSCGAGGKEATFLNNGWSLIYGTSLKIKNFKN